MASFPKLATTAGVNTQRFKTVTHGNSVKRRRSGHRSAGEREERTKRTLPPRWNMALKHFAQTLHSGGVTLQADFIDPLCLQMSTVVATDTQTTVTQRSPCLVQKFPITYQRLPFWESVYRGEEFYMLKENRARMEGA